MFNCTTVKGYREKVLAVRPKEGVQNLFDIRYFWLFTFMGLTVPYRIRFGKHCDEFRVTVAKQASVTEKPQNKNMTNQKSSWLTTPRSWFGGSNSITPDDRSEKFKKHMQEISLYQGKRKELTEIADSETKFLGHKIHEVSNNTEIKEIESSTEKGNHLSHEAVSPPNHVDEMMMPNDDNTG
jgi:hypothetical protein